MIKKFLNWLYWLKNGPTDYGRDLKEYLESPEGKKKVARIHVARILEQKIMSFGSSKGTVVLKSMERTKNLRAVRIVEVYNPLLKNDAKFQHTLDRYKEISEATGYIFEVDYVNMDEYW